MAPREERDVVVRRENRRVLTYTGAGVTEELLSPSLDSRLMLIQTTFAPHCGTGEKPRERKGDEAGLVLSGTLELHVDGRIHTLQAGDSFTLKGKGVHWCQNPGETDTVVAWVITPPKY